MKNQKLAVIGKGTAGSISTLFFSNYTNLDIDWYFDPKSPEQAVGEGTTLSFPNFLFNTLGLGYSKFEEVLDGTYKKGILKENYNGLGSYHHSFSLGNSGVHFNALKFQNLVYNKLKSKINIIPTKITDYNQIDSTHILDCSGKPSSYKGYNTTSIPVNSVHIVQCYWEKPQFEYTLTIARPYGWVFGVPLQNRCSVGYLYNKDINSLEEVKEDIKNIFNQYNLTPSNSTNTFSFNNYTKKTNFTERVSFNGNSSFFLEPIEATSIHTIESINIQLINMLKGDISLQQANLNYSEELKNIEHMIMLHYFAGSKFKTPFWENAYQNSLLPIKEMTSSPKFKDIFSKTLNIDKNNSYLNIPPTPHLYGSWGPISYYQNLKGLGILDKINTLVK